MNKKPPPKKKNLLNWGDLMEDQKLSLGDSEIVVKRVFDFILKLVMDKIRLHEVEALEDEYIKYKFFRIISDVVNISTICPDQEKELIIDKTISIEVPRIKIDSWASNKSKTIGLKYEYINNGSLDKSILSTQSANMLKFRQPLPTIKKASQNKLFGNNKDKEKEKEIKTLKDQLTPFRGKFEKLSTNQNNKKVEENFSSSSQSPQNKDVTTPISPNSQNPGGRTQKKFFTNVLNKLKGGEEEIPYEQFPLQDESKSEIMEDEIELLKERAYRNYFKEKELERAKRSTQEKENEEKSKEEEKKKKKLLEDMNKKPFSFDFDGKLINIKAPDPSKLLGHPAANTIIREKREGGSATNLNPKEKKKQERRSKSKPKKSTDPKIVVIRNEIEPDELPVRHYQPDPLLAYKIHPGVTMDFYGLKKSGGDYPPIENKLTKDEFNNLLQQYKPHLNIMSDEHLQPDKKEIENIPEENEGLNNSTKMTKIYEYMTQEEFDFLANSNSPDINKKKNIQGIDLLHPTKQLLMEIKKKQKKDKIKAMKDFKYENIHKFDDEKIYEGFNVFSETKSGFGNYRKKNMPKNVHVDVEKEMGVMKKYPRERVAKSILEISGKITRNIKKDINKFDPTIETQQSPRATISNNNLRK
jgi:hypothetical protein